jgi:hypothetical protein
VRNGGNPFDARLTSTCQKNTKRRRLCENKKWRKTVEI